eukprot:TRINITY_DN3792_c0_g2_i1.p4 TRINITY_DN3792_c0_g2~~TRINITY_DN3792_c0_g2_i1.p4  ORF type:complete len:214 (-),score=16.12 TRINITY_DN3792_c0_g2_i1:1746-2306(-)
MGGKLSSQTKGNLTAKSYNPKVVSFPVKPALSQNSRPKSSDGQPMRRVSFSLDTDIARHSLDRRKSFEVASKKVVDVFYARVLEDPLLSPFFAGIDMEHLKVKLDVLMTAAFCGVDGFDGKFPDLGKIHEHLIREQGLTMQHFDQFTKLFEQTMLDLHLPEFKQENAKETFEVARQSFEKQMIQSN